MKKIFYSTLIAILLVAIGLQSKAQSGGALVLDGAAQKFMRVPNNTALSVPDGNGLTISFRFKTTSNATSRLLARRTGVTNVQNPSTPGVSGVGYEVWMNADGRVAGNATAYNNTTFSTQGYNKNTSNADVVAKDGNWHYMAMVIINNTNPKIVKWYLDDGPENIRTGTNYTGTYDFSTAIDLIVGADATGANRFVGSIDEVRVYNYNMNLTDLATDRSVVSYNDLSSSFKSNIVAAWDFENISGYTVPNVQGNTAMNGTLEWIKVLPISLESFVAKCQTNGVALQWKTAQESNADYFEVLNSSDASTWVVLTKVNAKGLASAYSYIDNKGQGQYYQLRMVDKDGGFTTSAVVSSNCATNKWSAVIVPNPIKDNSVLTISGVKRNSLPLEIYTVSGQKLWSGQVQVSNGSANLSLPVAGLTKGVYYLKINDPDYSRTISFVK